MKPTVIDPKTTTRAAAFDLWMNAPNPMVTFFKTLDVTPLVGFSRKRGLKFNMLLCWCIGKAASEIKEFYTLPVGRELLQYDSIAVNTIVKNKTGEVSSCDVPFSADLAQFNADYLRLTRKAAESCENHDLTESMVIGTSAIVDTEIDGAVGMNSGIFNNPFIIWGKYHTATTLMILALLGFIGWSLFNRVHISHWGRRSAAVLIFGLVVCCFAAARDGLDKTIQHTIDGSCAPGLFPLVSVPTIVGCVGALLIIIAAIATPIAKTQKMREVWFYVMLGGAMLKIVTMEIARIIL